MGRLDLINMLSVVCYVSLNVRYFVYAHYEGMWLYVMLQHLIELECKTCESLLDFECTTICHVSSLFRTAFFKALQHALICYLVTSKIQERSSLCKQSSQGEAGEDHNSSHEGCWDDAGRQN